MSNIYDDEIIQAQFSFIRERIVMLLDTHKDVQTQELLKDHLWYLTVSIDKIKEGFTRLAKVTQSLDRITREGVGMHVP